MRSTYSFRVVSLSSLELWKSSRSRSSSFLAPYWSTTLYFSWRPKAAQNFSYFSRSSLSSLASSFLIFFSRAAAMIFSCRVCWSISREMFREKSGESTTPLTNRKQSGSRSAHLSMMSTPEEYSCRPFSYSRV